MTTQRDLDIAAETSTRPNQEPLTICDKCGWYVLWNHAKRCSPTDGRMAKLLLAEVSDVRSGQLGFGDGVVVFDIDEDFSVLFQVTRNGFSLRDVHRLGTLSVEEAADLVRALKGWRDAVEVKRKDGVG